MGIIIFPLDDYFFSRCAFSCKRLCCLSLCILSRMFFDSLKVLWDGLRGMKFVIIHFLNCQPTDIVLPHVKSIMLARGSTSP